MSQTTTVQSLFANALQTGNLDPAAAAVVVPNMTATIQAAMGVHVDDVQASNVCLVTLLLDDSGSITFVAGNTQAVIDGANVVLDAIGTTKETDGILAHARYLNAGILYPFVPLAQAVRLTAQNFRPNGFTPLYDSVAETLATVIAKAEDFAQSGVPCRSVTILVTDGADVGSVHHKRPESVKPLVEAALRSEQHIVCAMGISDGSTDFTDIFARMGVRPNWILTPGNTPHEIRSAFAMASRSAVRASQAATGGAFSQVAAGGFGSP
jgi:hypothetical protein